MKFYKLFSGQFVTYLIMTFLAFWIGKFVSFYLFEQSFFLQIFFCTIIVVANCLALWGFLKIYRLAKNRYTNNIKAFLFVAFSYFVVALPFAPDSVVLLKGMNPFWWPAAFILLSLCVVGLLFVLRLPALLCVERYGFKAIFPAVILTHLCEALSLLILPFVYTTGFAVPILFEKNMSVEATQLSELIVLVNPEISDEKREAIRTAGWNGINDLAEAVSIKTKQIVSSPLYRRITYVFPETTLFASQHLVRQLYKLLVAQTPDAQVVLVLGVRDGNQNVVYAAAPSKEADMRVWPLRIKSDLVPLVEGSFVGMYLGPKGTQTMSQGALEEAAVFDGAMSPLSEGQFLICYEALQFQNIFGFKRPAVVLTNHSVFSTWFVISHAYDTALQTLYRLAGRSLILVGNFGATQAFIGQKKEFAGTVFYTEKLGLSKIKP